MTQLIIILSKEHYDKALILLQKSHGILEVVNLEMNVRDRNLALVTFQNMAMWYQRQGMLEEWAASLTLWMNYVPHITQDSTIAERMFFVKNECKLRMQLCAILSQIHRHKEALQQAMKSVKMIHQLIKDLYDLWIYYWKLIESDKSDLRELKSKLANDHAGIEVGSVSVKTENSLTIQEKLAAKLLPIIEEVLKRMIKENKPYNFNEVVDIKEKPDMRNILGFLNQNEWVYNLNIGNIMQIDSVSNTQLMYVPRTEYELTRESFLDKITLLCVAYFCASTELRFILQLKEEDGIDEIAESKRREVESEYWHAKSLEIACVFLPSEWPLLNHILISYQKHHAPTQYTIPEESEYTDNLTIIKPLKGIQAWKYNPVVRVTPKPDPVLTPHGLSPLRNVTEEMLIKMNEQEVKTIVTQSHKNTGQNSVVNLKEESSGFRKSSNVSSVRAPEDKYEDAYDDSTIIEAKVKQANDIPLPRTEIEEDMIPHREFRRTNAIQPRQPSNNNNIDHMSRQVRNMDASINTTMLSNDIDYLQNKIDTHERIKTELKSVSTNTYNQTTPRITNKQVVNEIIAEFERDSQFFKNMSSLISKKLSEKSSEIFKENMFNNSEEKNEIIKSVISSYIKLCSMDDINKSSRELENDSSAIMEKSNNRSINGITADNSFTKSKGKKIKCKSSNKQRDDSNHSTGGAASKPEYRSEKLHENNDRQAIKETLQIDKHMNSFLDDCLTEDKSFVKCKSKKRSRNKNRPNTSLFNKKRKSSGNTTLAGFKSNMYRPSSAFAVNSKSKSKSKPKKVQNGTKISSINKYISNKSFDNMLKDHSRFKSRSK